MTLLIAAISSLICGCNGKTPDTPQTKPEEKVAVELTLVSSTENSVVVGVTLVGADTAYCLLADADSATPTLTALRKGEKVTVSGEVTFGDQ